MGLYNHLPRQHAADGSALAKQPVLVAALLTGCPYCEVRYSDMKSALGAVLLERLMTIMNHLRRLKDSDVRRRQATAKCTQDEVDLLQRLVEMIHDGVPQKTQRQLEEHVSDVSLDAFGYPTMVSAWGSDAGVS